jgi:dolichyl-phosphate-mannose-protein mannosyltransferase
MPTSSIRLFQYAALAFVCYWMLNMSSQMGFSYDINTFWAWAIRLRDVGYKNFYQPGYFADYLPSYLYVLSVVAKLGDWLSIAHDSPFGIRWIKLPAIFAHLALSWLVMKHWAQWNRKDAALFSVGGILSLVYLLSPAHVYNAAIYGQVDTVFALGTSLLIWSMLDRRPALAGLCLGIMLGFKPQTVFILPLYFLLVIRNGWRPNSKDFIQHLVTCLFSLIFLFTPFWYANPTGAIQHYISNFGSYPYYSVNAMNLYALLGLNWIDMSHVQVFGIFSGMEILLIESIALTGLILYWAGGIRRLKTIDEESALLIGAAFVAAVFFFAPQMHERYLFPLMGIMPFLFLRSRQLFFAFIIASLTICLNQIQAMDQFFGSKAGMTGPVAMFGALGNFAVLTLILIRLRYCLQSHSTDSTTDVATSDSPRIEQASEFAGGESFLVTLRRALPTQAFISRRQWLAILTAFVALLVWNLYDLGATHIPVTGIPGATNYQIYLPPGTTAHQLEYFRIAADGEARFKCGAQGNEVNSQVTYADFATWGRIVFNPPCDKAIIVDQRMKELHLISEIIVRDAAGSPIKALQICDAEGCVGPENSSLFDEAQYYQTSSRKNGTYFDEIYYARAAFELADKTIPFESTHPPLGKLLIAASTSSFGFAPFQWRMPGAIASAVIPILVLLLTIYLGGSYSAAILAAAFSTLDFTRVVLGRLATLDTQVTAWMLLAFVFLSRFLIDRIRESDQLKSNLALKNKDWSCLALAGLASGMAISTKWNAVFALIAIVLLSFAWVLLDFRQRARSATNSFKLASARQSFWQHIVKLSLCLTLLPLLVYYSVFVIEAVALHQPVDPWTFWQRQLSMYRYHSGLTAQHPFASAYFSWPFMQIPVYLWTQDFGAGIRASLAIIGNPAVWWSILPACLYLFWHGRIILSPVAIVPLVGFVALFFCWASASRIVFIYHFYAASCFGCILLALSIEDLNKKAKWIRFTAVGLAAILAYKFWPVYMGTPTSTANIDKGLRWFSTWVF